eukprot:11045639-Lingulodinium_polyedra.AAC.1
MPWFAAQRPRQTPQGSHRKVRNAAELGWKGRGQDASGAARLLLVGRPRQLAGTAQEREGNKPLQAREEHRQTGEEGKNEAGRKSSERNALRPQLRQPRMKDPHTGC